MSKQQWQKFFPLQTPRKEQTAAIDQILEAFSQGKRFFALEAGTGVGKSAIAVTIARALSADNQVHDGYENGAIFTTTQKLLQDQYERDFANLGMRSIKSASNYQCQYKRFNKCSDSLTELKLEEKGTKFWNTCTFNCVYRSAKQSFMDAPMSVTNFPYLLTESNYNGKIKPRKLLVIDEAHNVETELSKFIEIAVTERFAKSVLKLDMPEIGTHHQALDWIQTVYFPKLTSHLAHVNHMMEKYTQLKTKLDKFISLSRQLRMMEGHHQRLKDFLRLHTKENWVFESLQSDVRDLRKLSFKPIDISQFANQYLFRMGYHVLFMSATLIQTDRFLEMVGVNKSNAAAISIPSPFPIENRPTLFVPIGKMTAREIDHSLPILANAVRKILEAHKKEKGIIHTHSYKIANYLKKNIKSRRLLLASPDNRDQIIRKHMTGTSPTVLISPSMTEGIDLEGDASRFQVICKVPYPYLGDKLVKKRMHKWKWWYPFQTSKTVIQAMGRSVRSDTDSAVTYILDSDWERFYANNKQLFPSDFHECFR